MTLYSDSTCIYECFVNKTKHQTYQRFVHLSQCIAMSVYYVSEMGNGVIFKLVKYKIFLSKYQCDIRSEEIDKIYVSFISSDCNTVEWNGFNILVLFCLIAFFFVWLGPVNSDKLNIWSKLQVEKSARCRINILTNLKYKTGEKTEYIT